jgi:pyruvate, water dikinase
MKNNKKEKYILKFKEIGIKDVPRVGGKNASLGEMLCNLSKKGINVPDGFALTSHAYWYFLKENNLQEKLEKLVRGRKRENIKNLQQIGKAARQLILKGKFPKDLEKEIISSYKELSANYGQKSADVAIRSSGIAEDAPTDSFAGQFETFLNISGKKELLKSLKECLASSFNDRVIVYREEKKISHLEFALSIGVQKMVRSDLACSGINFTLDTETGFRDVVLINSIWGIGEMIVKGQVTPDEFYVFKPTLEKGFKSIILKNLGRKDKKYIYSNSGGIKEVKVLKKYQLKFSLNEEDILKLAKWAVIIEKHYKRPQDIEWAKDGKTGQLFIVQSRPETVHVEGVSDFYQEYKVETKQKPILKGIAVGDKIGQGKARVIPSISEISKFKKGEVLVTKMTDPDWVSIFPSASAIITEEGGKTCHAAIISRELGVPAIVGVKDAMKILKNGQKVTVDCTSGLDGKIFSGKVPYKVKKYNLKGVADLKTKIMLNVGAPETAFKNSFLPNHGIGLARLEFIIAEKIKVHPLALYYYEKIKDQSTQINLSARPSTKENLLYSGKKSEINKIIKQIAEITVEHKDKKEYFVKELAEGIAQIAASVYPKKVIVRFSDFKTNEYENMIGGKLFEGKEENPMMGFRGACRYLDKEFLPAFQMECQAIKRCRNIFGLENISLMIPFCRTLEEGKEVLRLMKQFGLEKGKKGLKVYVMCEIPSNVILANEFLDIFDGMSIGSNDLTQLILGLDRDNAKIAYIGDERNEAVKKMIKEIINICKKRKKYVGICGQAPSDFPEFAEFLMEQGMETISLNPDSVIKTILALSGKKNNY